jgi:hypothetical protein
VNLTISHGVQEKLADKSPPVTASEILQCFLNRSCSFLEDTREQNKTRPPTKWFISATNQQRLLKIIFIRKRSQIIIKTAYDPNAEELRIYRKYA